MSKRTEHEKRELLQIMIETHDITVENNRLLRAIYRFLQNVAHQPTSIRIQFEGATMPVTLNTGQSVVGTATEADAAGINVPIADSSTLSWATSDPGVATATTSSDGTVSVAGVAAGTATISVTDSANGLTTSDIVTVNEVTPPDVPVSIAINWGTPK